MSQQIRVLQCMQCKMYQVDLVKKAKKWECKICRQKQDMIKEFFRGSGPECRAKVQQLNLERGMMEEELEENLFISAQQQLEQKENSPTKQENTSPQKTTNKWANYVDESTNKSSTGPLKIEAAKQELTEKMFNNSRSKVSRPLKRPAESMPPDKKSCSKWNNFV
ncbi:MRN complex-interacting protein [Drosophila rhopaloa]|uniref:MRN complex-interacting protein N-terminal domain-containing protein n=1 Tax=Drosophila rhopaloa TaxID=1041015 RepID=A0ABM5HQK7_DRORH|nr:MRN complex-interacting protein [Drosophila rhopaloa]